MKKRLWVFAIILVVLVLVPSIGVLAKKKSELNYKKASLYVDQKIKLTVKNNKRKIKWSTSKKSVATVNKKGMVYAQRAGKATITAKIKNKKYKCKLTIKKRTIVNINNIKENQEIAFDANYKNEYRLNFSPSESGLYVLQIKSDGGKFYAEGGFSSLGTITSAGSCVVKNGKWCSADEENVYIKDRKHRIDYVVNRIIKKGKSSVFRFVKTNTKVNSIKLSQNVKWSFNSSKSSDNHIYYSFTAPEDGNYRIDGSVSKPKKADSYDYMEWNIDTVTDSFWITVKHGQVPNKKSNYFKVKKDETVIIQLYADGEQLNASFSIVKA